MQKFVEAEDQRQFVPRDHHATNDSTTAESFFVDPGKPLKLDFLRFQGEDTVSRVLTLHFSYYNTPVQQRILLASYNMDGEALVWFQDVRMLEYSQDGMLSIKLYRFALALQPMMMQWKL